MYGFDIENGVLKKYTGYDEVVEIPDCVTEIGRYAFEPKHSAYSFGFNEKSRIKEIVIPNSVTKISYGAFWGCTALESISIPDSVISIGGSAFVYCYSLKNVNIPDSVTVIEDSTFSGCKALESIIIPNSVTSIGKQAFSRCSSLKSISIPESLESIDSDAFQWCSIETVYMKSLSAWCNINFVGKCANPLCYAKNLFLNGESVTDIVIPNGITKIRRHTFESCKFITSVTIPDTVTIIEKEAFLGCESLADINIPDSVNKIKEGTFKFCESLTRISIPDSLTVLEEDAFYGCDSLKEVHINSLSSWCGINFADENANPLYYAENLYLNGKLVTDLVVPDDVTEIKSYAFIGCKSFASVTLPDSLVIVGIGAFDSNLNFADENEGMVVAGSTLLRYKGKDESVVIPESIKSIGAEAFSGCEFLKSVIIPDSVKTIGERAFYGCTLLTEIVIPDSVKIVAGSAFAWCSSLEKVSVGDSTKFIGDAFEGCFKIRSYYIFEEGKIVKKYLFKESEEIEKLYAQARIKYTIIYHREDSADDTSDNGMGYEYNNSFTLHREPKMEEMLIKDGELYGFVVYDVDNILEINGQKLISIDNSSCRYGDGRSWRLVDEPNISRYMFIPNVSAPSDKFIIGPHYFPKGLVKTVVKQVGQEDNYGDFGGAFNVTVELTDEAAADPDGTLAAFKKISCNCVLVKKP